MGIFPKFTCECIRLEGEGITHTSVLYGGKELLKVECGAGATLNPWWVCLAPRECKLLSSE